MIFVAGGLTSLLAFKRLVTDIDLGKTVDCKAGRFPDVFTGLGVDLALCSSSGRRGAISVDACTCWLKKTKKVNLLPLICSSLLQEGPLSDAKIS